MIHNFFFNTLGTPDSNTEIVERISFFHDYAMMISLMIMILILYLMINLSKNNFNNKMILHNQMLEIIWTIIPMITLFFLAIPSLKILYLSDEMIKPLLTVKTIGHQWYWSYEYSDFHNIEFDSFMLNYPSDFNNLFRLLDVDNRLIIPFNNNIRMLFTSSDVIHSWTIPSIGIKVDSIPGRINQASLYLNRPGNFFGQCSEICGLNHSFMPIMLESTNKINFLEWLNSNINLNS